MTDVESEEIILKSAPAAEVDRLHHKILITPFEHQVTFNMLRAGKPSALQMAEALILNLARKKYRLGKSSIVQLAKGEGRSDGGAGRPRVP